MDAERENVVLDEVLRFPTCPGQRLDGEESYFEHRIGNVLKVASRRWRQKYAVSEIRLSTNSFVLYLF